LEEHIKSRSILQSFHSDHTNDRDYPRANKDDERTDMHDDLHNVSYAICRPDNLLGMSSVFEQLQPSPFGMYVFGYAPDQVPQMLLAIDESEYPLRTWHDARKCIFSCGMSLAVSTCMAVVKTLFYRKLRFQDIHSAQKATCEYFMIGDQTIDAELASYVDGFYNCVFEHLFEDEPMASTPHSQTGQNITGGNPHPRRRRRRIRHRKHRVVQVRHVVAEVIDALRQRHYHSEMDSLETKTVQEKKPLNC
jgi:hypothetical protein